MYAFLPLVVSLFAALVPLDPGGNAKGLPTVIEGATLSDIRVKMKSRLSPARGLTVHFDMDPRTCDWTPKGGLFDRLEIASLKIAGVDREAVKLEVSVARLGGRGR